MISITATIALNREEIEKHSARITKIKPWKEWEGINFSSKKMMKKNLRKIT